MVITWLSSGKSRSQQEIKAIYPNTSQMLCVVLISVIWCSSVANRWPTSNWKLWSNHFLIVPNAPIIMHSFFPHFPHPADLDL